MADENRKFLEKRIRFYDDGDRAVHWIAGWHDPKEKMTIDAKNPVFISSQEQTSFVRTRVLEFSGCYEVGREAGLFTEYDKEKFEEVEAAAYDQEE